MERFTNQSPLNVIKTLKLIAHVRITVVAVVISMSSRFHSSEQCNDNTPLAARFRCHLKVVCSDGCQVVKQQRQNKSNFFFFSFSRSTLVSPFQAQYSNQVLLVITQSPSSSSGIVVNPNSSLPYPYTLKRIINIVIDLLESQVSSLNRYLFCPDHSSYPRCHALCCCHLCRCRGQERFKFHSTNRCAHKGIEQT